jgi:hypothetical protein
MTCQPVYTGMSVALRTPSIPVLIPPSKNAHVSCVVVQKTANNTRVNTTQPNIEPGRHKPPKLVPFYLYLYTHSINSFIHLSSERNVVVGSELHTSSFTALSVAGRFAQSSTRRYLTVTKVPYTGLLDLSPPPRAPCEIPVR